LLDSAGKLYGGRVPQVCSGLGDYFRDVTDHLVRVNQTIDSVRDMVDYGDPGEPCDDHHQRERSHEAPRRVRRARRRADHGRGVYGMNFEHMPELKWEFGYPLAVWVMVLIDVVLYWRFRRAGWL
jgi:magnesium transporter